jgi:signal transduction histidine kinase
MIEKQPVKLNMRLFASSGLKGKLLSIVTLTLIIVAVAVIINNVLMSQYVKKNNAALLDSTDAEIIGFLKEHVSGFNNSAEYIANSNMIRMYSQNGFYCTDGTHDNNDLFFYLDVLSDSNQYIDNIYVYDYVNQYLIENKGYSDDFIAKKSFPWFIKNVSDLKSEEDRNKYCVWNYYNDYISITYRADLINPSLKNEIYITFNILKEDFYRLLASMKMTENSMSALISMNTSISTNDILLVFDENEGMTAALTTVVLDNFPELSLGQDVTFEYDYEFYYLRYTSLDDKNEIGMLYIIPTDDLGVRSYDYIIIGTLVAAIVAIIICYLVFRRVLMINVQKPITELIKGMEKVGNGDFTSKLDGTICKDEEIRGLFTAYNSMTDQATTMIEQLYQAELYRKQLELQSLQDKIDPHFLYNTLDTINWTAKEHHVDEISRMVIALSTMYRRVFNKGKDLTTIIDALEGISCYLDIQRVRHGQSFSYTITCPKELEDCVILNLIIQTIVENAIIHGLEDQSEGRLTIKVERQNDDIIINVEDNGIGMTSEKLDLINSSINSAKLESESGLRNVQKRIRLYYGNQYGITILSTYKTGTKVTIRVPYKEKQKDD